MKGCFGVFRTKKCELPVVIEKPQAAIMGREIQRPRRCKGVNLLRIYVHKVLVTEYLLRSSSYEMSKIGT